MGILVVAYDVLKAIYLERGYRLRDIPRLILEKNLYGLDIDDRAAQLAGFALLMKARADDRRLLSDPAHPPRLNVLSLQESKGLKLDDLATPLAPYNVRHATIWALIETFEHAKTFGSLIQIPPSLKSQLPLLPEVLAAVAIEGDLYARQAATDLLPLVRQAQVLAMQFDAVVANPPYMGAGYHNVLVKELATADYAGSKADLYSMFMHRCMSFGSIHSIVSMMTPFTWLSIKSFEGIRSEICAERDIISLVQPEYHAFFESAYVPICAFVLRNTKTDSTGVFVDLSPFYGAEIQGPKLLEAIADKYHAQRFEKQTRVFEKLPGKAIP